MPPVVKALTQSNEVDDDDRVDNNKRCSENDSHAPYEADELGLDTLLLCSAKACLLIRHRSPAYSLEKSVFRQDCDRVDQQERDYTCEMVRFLVMAWYYCRIENPGQTYQVDQWAETLEMSCSVNSTRTASFKCLRTLGLSVVSRLLAPPRSSRLRPRSTTRDSDQPKSAISLWSGHK